jgi:hypothetical protein
MQTRRSTNVFVAGLLFLVLGAGNSYFGESKLNSYRAELQAVKAELGAGLPEPKPGTRDMLHKPSDADLLYESSLTKYQYYKVVMRGGHLFGLLGLALLAGVALRRFFVPSR